MNSTPITTEPSTTTATAKRKATTGARALLSIVVLVVGFATLFGAAAAMHKTCAGSIPAKVVWKWQSCPTVADPFAPYENQQSNGSRSPGATDTPGGFPVPLTVPGPNGYENPKG